MEMLGNRRLGVTQQQAWEALNDPETLKKCIPGCDKFELTGDNQYTVALALKIGPVSAKFNGKVALADIAPPDSYKLSFEGQGGVAGFAKGSSSVSLKPVADGSAGCELDYTVNAQVGGKIAQLGQRLIDGAAKSTADDFFKRFDAEMQRRHGAPPADEAAAAEAAPAEEKTGAVAGFMRKIGIGGKKDGNDPPQAAATDIMENLDVMVLRTLRDWRLAGRRALLTTVVRTWGSSPRPVGSIMALADDGAVVGSVSGGCIEDDLIAHYSRAHGSGAEMPSGPPALVKYGITADEAHRFGLPCGGTLELLLEYDPDAASLVSLVASLEEGRLMQRTVTLADGAVSVAEASAPDELSIDANTLTNTFGPEYRMLLIGAGQLAEYLATMAKFSGFAVTLCDPRTEYRTAWTLPGVTMSTEMPDDAVTAFRPDRRTCVVALTHDPKLDDLALLEALHTEAFYVGAIGSRRNAQARRERMIEHFDETAQSLARLRGPIGIYIGSKTPPEIAVSVMAEILAVKNAVALPRETDVAHAKTAAGSGK